MAGGLGFVGTIVGVVIGWWISSNFLAGPAAQITGQLSNVGQGVMSHMPHQGGYGDDGF